MLRTVEALSVPDMEKIFNFYQTQVDEIINLARGTAKGGQDAWTEPIAQTPKSLTRSIESCSAPNEKIE